MKQTISPRKALSEARAYLKANSCPEKWLDGFDEVCTRHGFAWEEGKRHCNGAEAGLPVVEDLVEALKAEFFL